MRSPAVANELHIDWIDAEWPTSWDEKYGNQALPLSSLSQLSDDRHKPSLVYVVREGSQEKIDAMEQKLFGNEKLILTSRFFRCYRISEKDIPKGKIHDQYLLKKHPTFIILDAKGNEVVKNTKKASSNWLNTKLKKQFAIDFNKKKLSTHVKKLSNWLDDLEKADDALADAQRAYDAVDEQVSKKDNPKKRAQDRLAKAQNKLKTAQAEFDKLVKVGKELSNPQEKRSETAKN